MFSFCLTTICYVMRLLSRSYSYVCVNIKSCGVVVADTFAAAQLPSDWAWLWA